MRKTLSIAGSDPTGGAGIQADLKTFAALGTRGATVLTSVTAQNSSGVFDRYDLPRDMIKLQFESIMDETSIDYAKTGMLSSAETIAEVSDQIRRYNIQTVVDPVIYAESGSTLLKKDAISALIGDIIPLASVVTPNIHEASILSGITIKTRDDAKRVAAEIKGLGAKSVIITGGHLDGVDILYDGDFELIPGRIIPGKFHGTGCTYSSALTAELAKGVDIRDAAAKAREFVLNSIDTETHQVNQTLQLYKDADRYKVLENVMEAISKLLETDFADLIPQVGSNIGMAIAKPENTRDVAAIEGRIIKLGDSVEVVGCVKFGASDHIARIILAAMQSDDRMRSAINLRYDEQILSICKKLGFEIGHFDRKKEPEGVKTMDWGISNVIKRQKRVPDLVYDKGGVGKEPMIRMLGTSATGVVSKVIKVIEAMYSR